MLFNVEFVAMCVLICHDWALIATCGKALINDYDYDYDYDYTCLRWSASARAHVHTLFPYLANGCSVCVKI